MAGRLRWARAMRRLVAERQHELLQAVHADIHKPAWETVTQELMPLVASLRWHEARAPGLLAPRRIGGAPWWALGQRHWSIRAPAGRVLIIATWNYPVQLLGVQLTQAVMAGNCVTVKPSERAPRSQRLLVDLARQALREADADPDLIVSAPATREAGRTLLEAEQFDHVVFTGSTAVGRQIAQVCAATLTPSTLELSGRDSAIVLADAPMALAARSIWYAVTMNAGQTCMAPRRVLVERAGLQEFLAHLRPLAAAARPMRLADPAMAERCMQLVLDAVKQGGHRLSAAVECAANGVLRAEAVVDCPRNAALVAGDHFGPVVAVLPVSDLQDALAVHSACGQHLASSVYTGSPSRVLRNPELISQLGSSIVTVNDSVVPSAHPGVAIAGRAASGWGASRGAAGLLALTREVAVTSTSRWPRLPLDEPRAQVKAWIARFAVGRARVAAGRDGPAGQLHAAASTDAIPGEVQT